MALRESGFARILTALHPVKRSERSTGVCRVYGERENSVACEEVREGECAGSPEARWARVWALTATTGEAARGPAMRRREIGNRECDNM